MAERIKDEVRDQIMNDYAGDDLSIKEILTKYGIAPSTISVIHRDYPHIPNRKPPGPKRKNNVNDHYLDVIDSQEKAYFLGFFMGDGCNSEDRDSITIEIHNKDIKLLQKFKDMLDFSGPLYTRETRDHCKISIKSRQLSKRLAELECVQRKSKFLKMPSIDLTLARHLLRGLMDADGCIFYRERGANAKECTVEWYATESVCQSIQKMLKNHLDIKASVRYKPASNIYTCTIYKFSSVMKFLDWVYEDSTIHLDRKYQIYQSVKQKWCT